MTLSPLTLLNLAGASTGAASLLSAGVAGDAPMLPTSLDSAALNVELPSFATALQAATAAAPTTGLDFANTVEIAPTTVFDDVANISANAIAAQQELLEQPIVQQVASYQPKTAEPLATTDLSVVSDDELLALVHEELADTEVPLEGVSLGAVFNDKQQQQRDDAAAATLVADRAASQLNTPQVVEAPVLKTPAAPVAAAPVAPVAPVVAEATPVIAPVVATSTAPQRGVEGLVARAPAPVLDVPINQPAPVTVPAAQPIALDSAAQADALSTDELNRLVDRMTQATPQASQPRAEATPAPVAQSIGRAVNNDQAPAPTSFLQSGVATATSGIAIASQQEAGTGGQSQSQSQFHQQQTPAIPDGAFQQLTETTQANKGEFAGRLAQANTAAQTPAEQVSVQIQKHIGTGAQQITVQLNPAELGKVDVRLDLRAEGSVAVTVLADKSETLDMLQRDARGLERALAEAGIKTDSSNLSFDLREQGNQFGGRDGQQQQAAANNDTQEPTGAPVALAGGGYVNYSSDNALDIMV